MIICPNCGTELSDTAKFCRKCGTKIEIEEKIERPEEPVFEEPVDEEDGSVAFNWDQPVEIEETKIEKNTDPDPDVETEPETETADAAEDGSEESYDWGPPTGEGDEKDDSMMPVAFAGRESGLEEVGSGEGYGYGRDSVIPPWDHTHEFDPEDISENKVMAMAAYLLGPIGVIIALLAAQSSPYAGFHVRQGLKFTIVEALVCIVMVLLCWTFVVPAAAAIFLIILMVLKIIAFVSVCKGKAIEPPIIRNLKFLK